MTNQSNRQRICIVVSDFMTVRAFLQEQICALSKTYEVTLVANVDDRDALHHLTLNAKSASIAIARKIDLGRDVGALLQLYSLFRRHKFALIHSITPKAGLLSMVAGKLAGVPARLHTFTGQVWATQSGVARYLLKSADRITVFCATQILVDSRSQLKFLIDEGVVVGRNGQVLANGSISGVDGSRFRPDAAARRQIREEISIPEDASMFLFVGRLNKDKGVLDLAAAFEQVAARRGSTYLVCVGPDESSMEVRMRSICSSCGERLRFIGQTNVPERYMAAADVICLPSYREGFGSAVIEAAATGIPAIASRIYGLTDAVEDGVTGCLHSPGNWRELAHAMESLTANRCLRLRLGQQARERANKDFAALTVTEALLAFYREQVGAGVSPAATRGQAGKRTFDLLLAMLTLAVLSPVLAAVAIAVRTLLGSPILFRQRRPGWHGKLFSCLKFRTMNNARDAEGRLLPDADRMTTFGRFLRISSLDELPELINVLRGEMSLVGPRPLLPQYLERYTPEQMRRHAVRPGITGWAQVNGRNSLDWGQKFALDVWYVDNQSLWLDLRILARTAWLVLRCAGIAQRGHATMPEFVGEPVQCNGGNE